MSKNIGVSAFLLGIIFETTIFAETPGIGYLLFWSLTLGTTIYLLQSAERLRTDRLWMFLPSLILAFSLFRFDAAVVRIWGAGLGLFFLAWAVAWNLVPERTTDSLARFLPKETWSPGRVKCGAAESLRVECSWERDGIVQVIRGLLFGAFLLLIFGTLLAQADAVFGSKIHELCQTVGTLSIAPTLRVFIWLALFAGLLKVWLMSQKLEPPKTKSMFSPTELYIALGSLNTLLGAFLVIQARYLFGSRNLVEELGFSHAQYARRGFFELTLCIALILPLVLVAYRAAEVNREKRLRFLGGGLILAALGLAVSALKRMMLYIEVYGLSVERFYAAAGILVALTVLGWAGWACLQPQSVNWLLTRQKITVIICLSFLSLVNADMLVARSHLNLVKSGERSLDYHYLGTLSADILPVLDEFQNKLTTEQSAAIKRVRERILRKTKSGGWPSFNISRNQVAQYDPPGPATAEVITDSHRREYSNNLEAVPSERDVPGEIPKPRANR